MIYDKGKNISLTAIRAVIPVKLVVAMIILEAQVISLTAPILIKFIE